MYKLKMTRREKKELAYVKWLLILLAIVGVIVVVWLAWVRPSVVESRIDTFAECRAAGNTIQTSYPEVCLLPNGKRFVNPEQAKSHEASRKGTAEPIMPSDSAQLYLPINEWKVRVPLTEKTFDLMYSYLDDGISERVTFTFKRLVNAGFCKSDAGVTLTRSVTKNESPFTPEHPEAIAQIGNYYFYVSYAGSPCYDTANAEQAALIKQIAGDQSLTQAVGTLLPKLTASPDQ